MTPAPTQPPDVVRLPIPDPDVLLVLGAELLLALTWALSAAVNALDFDALTAALVAAFVLARAIAKRPARATP